MELSARLDGDDVLVVGLSQSCLDSTNAHDFYDAMRSLMPGRTRILVDLTGVTFVDASGLGALMSCLRHVHGCKGELRLCEMDRRVRVLFDLMRMQRVFNIQGSRGQALASFH